MNESIARRQGWPDFPPLSPPVGINLVVKCSHTISPVHIKRVEDLIAILETLPPKARVEMDDILTEWDVYLPIENTNNSLDPEGPKDRETM